MNITYMVGNGFDINMGLKTKYSDYYPYFIERSAESNMIREWIKENEMLWADLEEKLGVEISNVNEENLSKFYEDKYELDSLLLDYLEEEQKKIDLNNVKEKTAEEMENTILTFHRKLPEASRISLNETLKFFSEEDYVYRFITFNYTDILSRIFNITRKIKNPIATHVGARTSNRFNNILGEILHIHGTIDEEMILGVNDENQINNVKLKEDEIFLNTLIKSKMNKCIGQNKTEKAKEIIKGSCIICIFGMSLGNTDKMWWEIIVEWLNTNNHNLLVLYHKGSEDELRRRIPAKIINLDNKWKNLILEKGKGSFIIDELEKLKNRIFISYNTDIFNFKKIIDEDMKQNG